MELTDEEKDLILSEVKSNSKINQKMIAKIENGTIDDEDVNVIDEVIKSGLESGSIYNRHGFGVESIAISLFKRLPSGSSMLESIDQVNKALQSLKDMKINKISCSMSRYGVYRVTLDLDSCSLTLEASKDGLRISSLEL
ncbi:MAG: hypothetical protein ACE5J2_06125 [Nitrososphaerales archaeon]